MPQMRLVMKWASRGSLPFIKMLYPRKIDEVLWHSATCLLAKSILVKMPRLPTIRVMGSQFISTSCLGLTGTSFCGAIVVRIAMTPYEFLIRSGVVTGGKLGPAVPPFWLFVDRTIGQASQ